MEFSSKNKCDPTIIREVQKNDAEAIYNVGRKTWLDCYPSAEYGVRKSDIEKKYAQKEKLIKKGQKRILDHGVDSQEWVAVKKHSVIGFSKAYRDKGRALVGAIYVLPEFQGCGIGSKLLAKVIAFFKNSKEIWVEVAIYNKAAIKFYEKFGFIMVRGSESRHSIAGDVSIPTIKMLRQK